MLKNESMEMYLETILRQYNQGKSIREVDFASVMNIFKVSVCKVVKRLSEKGFVIYENRRIILTGAGRKIAEQVYERHCVLTKFLVTLGVSLIVAEQDACRIEHCISEETFLAIKSK